MLKIKSLDTVLLLANTFALGLNIGTGHPYLAILNFAAVALGLLFPPKLMS